MRRHIIFSGNVQGVGFRYILSMYAVSLKLTGFVRNLSDGDVEAEVQGSPENIAILISKMHEVKHIRIDEFFETTIPEVKDETKFKIRS